MSGIKLVISDVDGTLVTTDKRLTDASCRAAAALAARGIGFTVTSSRPPFGLRMLVEPLALKLPIGAFNGGMIVDPAMTVLEQRLIPQAAAKRCLDVLAQFDVEPWLFTVDKWTVRNSALSYVAREQRTIQTDPNIVSDFAPFLAQAGKIVGVSEDFERLARCEAAMQEALGATASAARSQRYYLDITPPHLDKGTFVDALSKRLNIAKDAIVTIGDMPNDLAMFRRSGRSIAMGNADDSVKREAQDVTRSNEEDGFAWAVEKIILASG